MFAFSLVINNRMDTNTIIVIVVNGGLIIFFIYALYYIRSPIKPPKTSQKPIKKTSSLPKISTQSIARDKINFQEKKTSEFNKPIKPTLTEYEPVPEEPAPPEYESQSVKIQDQVDKPLKIKEQEM